MSNIIIGTFIAQKLASKLMQFRIFASRHKHKSTSRPPINSDSGSPGGKKSSPTFPAAGSETSSTKSCNLVPVSKKDQCSPGPRLYSTMDDMPLPCGWYSIREVLITSFYNRVLTAGLLVLVISFYLFKKDKVTQTCTSNYKKYMGTFDYDTAYGNVSESEDLPLEDCHDTTTA